MLSTELFYPPIGLAVGVAGVSYSDTGQFETLSATRIGDRMCKGHML